MPATQIQGQLSLAVGTSAPAIGQIKIANPPFTDVDGNYHPANSGTIITINPDGTYAFELAPTANSSPSGIVYTATFYLGLGQVPTTEYWTVPSIDSGASLTIQQLKHQASYPAGPLSILVDQLYSAAGNIGDVLVNSGAGGFAPVTIQAVYPFTFTSQTSFTVPQSHHGQGTSLITQIYAQDGSQLDGAVNVNPVTGDLTVKFTESHSGFGFIFGGIGRGLPNWAKSYFNQAQITVSQGEHRFNTPNLIVQVYDQNGYLVTDEFDISVTPTFDVSVYVETQQSFKVVVCGCLGSTTAPGSTGTSPGGGGTPPPTATTPYVTTDRTIAATSHGKGATAYAKFFTADRTPYSVAVNYQKDPNGNITVDPLFTGTVQVNSAAFVGISQPYVQSVSNITQPITVPAVQHGQGIYAIWNAFDSDNNAVTCFARRTIMGDLTLEFGESFSGRIEISAGGWVGSSAFIIPVTAQTEVIVSSSQHLKGTLALAQVFTNDAVPIAGVGDYVRDNSGNMRFEFSPPFSGSIQIYSPQ